MGGRVGVCVCVCVGGGGCRLGCNMLIFGDKMFCFSLKLSPLCMPNVA